MPSSRSALRRFSVPSAVASVTLGALALSGCASTAASPAPTPTVSISQAVTVDNCGTEVTFDSAPQRVVTIKSSTTESLLALGLADRIVGTAFQDGPVPEQWADAAASIPSISEQVPSEEVVLEEQPDMVFAGWESNFAADGAGERPELSSLGVATYVAPAACRSVEPPKLTFDDVFGDIEELAAIFRVDPSDLIAEQTEALEAIEPVGDGRTALWYSSGTDTPYVGAGRGAPELILETVGLTNIAADVDATWAPYSWEAIVAADPDVIVLVDASWNTAQSKIDLLESNPATMNLTAVRNGAFVVLPFAATEAGVRTVEAAADLADQLAALDD